MKLSAKYSRQQFPLRAQSRRGHQALTELRRIGFNGVQFDIRSLSESTERNAKLRRLLADLGLVASVHSDAETLAETFMKKGVQEDTYRSMRKAIDIAVQVDSSSFSFHPPMWKSPLVGKHLLKAQAGFLQFTNRLRDYAKIHNLDLALESYCYRPFIVSGISEFMNLVREVADLNILLELGHLHQAGLDPLAAIRAFGSRLIDVHVHDAMKGGDYRTHTHLPIGRGEIDFANVLRSLRKIHYEKWLTLEIVGTMGDLVRSYELLKDVLDETATLPASSSLENRINAAAQKRTT